MMESDHPSAEYEELRFTVMTIDQKRWLWMLVVWMVQIPISIPLLMYRIELHVDPTVAILVFFGMMSMPLLLGMFLSVGRLTISVSDGTMRFQWKRRYGFPQTQLPNIHVSDIRRVVWQREFIRSIETTGEVIHLDIIQGFRKDSHRLGEYLEQLVGKNNVVSYYDVLAEHGKLHSRITAYIVLGVLGCCLVILFVLYHQEPIWLLLCLPALALFSGAGLLHDINKRVNKGKK